MSAGPFLSRITIFPIKSLDGIALPSALIVEGGCLEHDREFAIADYQGQIVKGKNNEKIFSLRSNIDFATQMISFRYNRDDHWNSFHLQSEQKKLNEWLSDYFGFPVDIMKDKRGNFLDIPGMSGATLVSKASLETVSGWFEGLSFQEVRKRFRATLEIDGIEAFWEDHLFERPGSAVEFKLGNTRLLGIGPRERCSVPTRDTHSGNILHGFPKQFARHRQATMPAWSSLGEYDHHYHFCVDCHIPDTEVGKFLSVGDKLNILGRIKLGKNE